MPVAHLTLARRLEAAEASMRRQRALALAAVSPQSQATAEPIDSGWAAFAGPGSPGTCALGLGMKGPVAEADLDRLEDFYRSRNVPAVVEVCPLADASLLELLDNRGYRLVAFTNVLVQSLPVAGPSLSAAAPGVEVRRAAAEEADLWARTVALGWVEGQDVTEEVLRMVLPLFEMPSATCFLAVVDGKPVGGGAVATHDGVALMFSASTRPEFRGRGAQVALLGARLSWAATAGCDLALTLTVPGSASERNVERAGFRVVYTKVTLTRRW